MSAWAFNKMETVEKLLFLSLCFMVLNVPSRCEGNMPRSYWRFENSSNLTEDSMGAKNLVKWESIGAGEEMLWRTQTDGGIVGGYVDFTGRRANDTIETYWQAEMGTIPMLKNKTTCTGVTIELLFKAHDCFMRGGTWAIFTTFPPTKGTRIIAEMREGELSWTADTVGAAKYPADELAVDLNGIGVNSVDYLFDGEWHHLVFQKNARSGDQSIWIDGQSPLPFKLKGNSTDRTISSGSVFFDGRGSYAACASFDEIVVYEKSLEDSMIYQHYLDSQAHKPYSSGSTPAPPPSPFNATFDPLEFPPGAILPTHPGNVTMGVNVTTIEQITSFPKPRYSTSATLRPNFNWMDPGYLGGQGQHIPLSNVTSNATIILKELAESWNYALDMDGHSCCNALQNATIAMANANPNFNLTVVIMRIQEHTYLLNQSLPDSCYLQNSAGQFINCRGDIIAKGGKKILRPTTPELATSVGCPDSTFDHDGLYFRDHVFSKMDALLTRPINIINEDGEIFVSLGQVGECGADPKVMAAYNASGAPNWETYSSMWRLRLTARFRDLFLKAGLKSLMGTHYSEYQVQGSNPYFGNWTYTRQIGTPYTQANGVTSYYSTLDMYPVHPHWWWSGAGAWHGFSWVEMVRKSEIANGDVIFSPFVAAGWSIATESNYRPGPWLGMLKILGVWGAEFYYTGFFSLGAPFPPSQNWIWQAVMPSYAQAITSLYADAFFNGKPLENDDVSAYDEGGYLLWAGAPNRVAIARKHNSKDLYVIATCIARQSNENGNALLNATATVRLPNNIANVTITTRQQGSVYVLDMSTKDAPALTQLDGWHEATHPWYWSSGIHIEAELGEMQGKSLSMCSECTIRPRTELHAQSTHHMDFVNAVTFVRLSPVTQSHPIKFVYESNKQNFDVTVTLRSQEKASLRLSFVCQQLEVATFSIETSVSASWTALEAIQDFTIPELCKGKKIEILLIAIEGVVDIDSMNFH
eukprot:m.172848 g.172848  ORF g.172848 m.172848 type:complete len:980 (+) comp15377_c0_seq4:492-3431(+)